MKKIVVLFSALLLVMSFVGAAAAGEAESSTEKKTISLWVTSYIPTQEMEKPRDEWYFTQAIERFEAENPDIKVDWSYQESQQQVPNKFKAAFAAKAEPDMVNIWTGMMLLDIKDILMPLDDYVTAEDLQAVNGWSTVRDDLDPNGAILGIPILGSELCVVYYNKKLVENAGMDFEADPPKTVNEFFTALDNLKQTGVVPWAHDEGASPRTLMFFTAYWWAQQSGYPRIVSNGLGQTKFSEDQGFKNMLEAYRRMFAEGYMNQDVLSARNTRERLVNDQVAMVPGGNWQLSYYDSIKDNIGVIKAPDFTQNGLFTDSILGGPGQALVVSKNSKYPAEAVALGRFLNSKDENLIQNKLNPRIPINNYITVDELGYAENPIQMKFLDWGSNYNFWVDNSIQSEVYLEMERLSALYLTGGMSMDEYTKRLDDKAAEVNR
ncbi:MAG: extracellular solute-binding protein [Spirochaetia bacterium]|nr:extracellular solute-binding protein [Spirochaetia bacterium]